MLTKIDAKIVTVIISENRMIVMNMKAANTSFRLSIDTNIGAHLIAILTALSSFLVLILFYCKKVHLDDFDGSAATAVEILTTRISWTRAANILIHWESRAHWENGSFDELPALIKLICYHLSAESFDKKIDKKVLRSIVNAHQQEAVRLGNVVNYFGKFYWLIISTCASSLSAATFKNFDPMYSSC